MLDHRGDHREDARCDNRHLASPQGEPTEKDLKLITPMIRRDYTALHVGGEDLLRVVGISFALFKNFRLDWTGTVS